MSCRCSSAGRKLPKTRTSPAGWRGTFFRRSRLSAELVHRVVRAARLQGSLAGEVFLVLVADIGAGHVLVPDTGDALTDLLALDVLHVAEHALIAEIGLGQVVGGE